jgi:hypothetical protein
MMVTPAVRRRVLKLSRSGLSSGAIRKILGNRFGLFQIAGIKAHAARGSYGLRIKSRTLLRKNVDRQLKFLEKTISRLRKQLS